MSNLIRGNATGDDAELQTRLWSLMDVVLRVPVDGLADVQVASRRAMAATAAFLGAAKTDHEVALFRPNLEDAAGATTHPQLLSMLEVVLDRTQDPPGGDPTGNPFPDDLVRATTICVQEITGFDRAMADLSEIERQTMVSTAARNLWPPPETDPVDVPLYAPPADLVVRGNDAASVINAALSGGGGIHVLRRTFPVPDRAACLDRLRGSVRRPASSGLLVISDEAVYAGAFGKPMQYGPANSATGLRDTTNWGTPFGTHDIEDTLRFVGGGGTAMLYLNSADRPRAHTNFFWWLCAALAFAPKRTTILVDAVNTRAFPRKAAVMLCKTAAAAAARGVSLVVYAPTGLGLPWRTGSQDDFGAITSMLDIWPERPSGQGRPYLTATIFRGRDAQG